MHILYADDSLLAVNKPAGIATVPEGWEKDAPHLRGMVEEEFGKVWVVHRLDKVTSGVVIFARSADAHRTLSMLFENREARKTYHGVLNGEPRWDEHHAKHPLRINKGHNHRSVVDHSKGKPCETVFRVLERKGGLSQVEALPLSGRTHQIRVHAAALGFPLLGDVLYGAPQTELIARSALHAYSLEFTFEGKMHQFTAPHPADLQAVWLK